MFFRKELFSIGHGEILGSKKWCHVSIDFFFFLVSSEYVEVYVTFSVKVRVVQC